MARMTSRANPSAASSGVTVVSRMTKPDARGSSAVAPVSGLGGFDYFLHLLAEPPPGNARVDDDLRLSVRGDVVGQLHLLDVDLVADDIDKVLQFRHVRRRHLQPAQRQAYAQLVGHAQA